MPEVALSQGTIHYREEGSGPAVVLIHGLMVDGGVWSPLVPFLRSGHDASFRTCRSEHIGSRCVPTLI